MAGFGSVHWVLARALCRFIALDLTPVPRSARGQALALRLMQTSSYANTGHYVAWHAGHALVWYWDQDVLLSSMADVGVAAKKAQVWPESVLYAPQSVGLRLVATMQGVEGQYWEDGHLQQCRWWKHAVNAEEWLNFQRDIGLAVDARQPQVPDAQALPFQSAPTMGASGEATSLTRLRDERLGYAFGALLLVAPTAWMGTDLVKTRLALQEVQKAISAEEGTATPLIAARDQALRSAERSRALLALSPYPDPLDLMARFASVLPKGGTYVKEWDFQDGKLKVVLVTPGNALSSSTLVSALELAGGFSNVQVVPGNDPKVLQINADVIRKLKAADV